MVVYTSQKFKICGRVRFMDKYYWLLRPYGVKDESTVYNLVDCFKWIDKGIISFYNTDGTVESSHSQFVNVEMIPTNRA